MKVLDLFSGIGGFSIGLERAGMTTVAFCEQDAFCQHVLAQHWPGVPIYDDVRTLTADTLRRDGIAVDVICGGFPCQDLSFAGRRAGLEGARSGLWGEYARLIGELRPRFVVVENVPGLLSLGMGTVLGDLAALGYYATWDCIPASAVGAPHRRDRVWIIAFANSATVHRRSIQRDEQDGDVSGNGSVPNANGEGEHDGAVDAEVGVTQKPVADADEFARHQGRARDAAQEPRGWHADRGGERKTLCHSASRARSEWQSVGGDDGEECAAAVGADWWIVEPDVGRVADGVPARVDRLRALGNAVVPQIPELIGRAIMRAAA